jgi:hypothetical protein
MNAPNDNTAPKGLRGRRASPARSGMRRIISPWEYRRLRFWVGVHIGGGIDRRWQAAAQQPARGPSVVIVELPYHA